MITMELSREQQKAMRQLIHQIIAVIFYGEKEYDTYMDGKGEWLERSIERGVKRLHYNHVAREKLEEKNIKWEQLMISIRWLIAVPESEEDMRTKFVSKEGKSF